VFATHATGFPERELSNVAQNNVTEIFYALCCRTARAFILAAAETADDDDSGGGGGGGAAAAPGMMASISSQRVMFRMLLGALSYIYVLQNIPVDKGSYKTQLLLVLACLDAFLLYGHLWDRVPNMQAILNCRFLYVCFLAVLNAAVFMAWGPYLSTPFALAPPPGRK
jgi:hypothetical protein